MTVVSPAACSPAISTALLTCADGTGSSIDDRHEIAGAAQRQRQRLLAGLEHLQAPFASAAPARAASAVATATHRRSFRTVIGWPAMTPIISRVPVPELPKSSGPCGWRSPPGPRPLTSQTSPSLFRRSPESGDGARRIDDVLRLQQPPNAGRARRQRPENQRPVRDRFVAGHAKPAAQRRRAHRRQGFRGRSFQNRNSRADRGEWRVDPAREAAGDRGRAASALSTPLSRQASRWP